MKISEVYTIESFANSFIYNSYVIEEDRWYTYIINPELNQSRESEKKEIYNILKNISIEIDNMIKRKKFRLMFWWRIDSLFMFWCMSFLDDI